MSNQMNPVREKINNMLSQSSAFTQLPEEKKNDLIDQMEKIGSFIAQDPSWLTPKNPVRARALEDNDAITQLKSRLAKKPGQVGAEFTAGAVREGTQAFKELIEAVDFPDFVSDLIQGVFQAIVDASIQQMEAYTEMIAAVSKSVDQFAKEQIKDSQARDYLANRYPSILAIDTSGERALIRPRDNNVTTEEVSRDFNINVDLDDEESEQELVNRAKLEMAQSRQQLLATMVLLGINRIIVTNGRINAKVIFDIEASDEASRRATASLYDEKMSKTTAAAGAWSPWGAAGAATSKTHKTTIKSSITDTSESNIQAKAQLTGEVRVNFRSDTVPLERMVDRLDLQVLTTKAEPPRRTRGVSPAPAQTQQPQKTK